MGIQPAVKELDQAEDVGFYFKYIGGLAFGRPSAALEGPGATSCVTTSGKHGLVIFSDLSGVYALQASDLVPKLSTSVASEGYVLPRPADTCLWHKRLRGITQLALSADEAVLAAVDSSAGTVIFYPLAGMRESDISSPHWSLPISGIKQFSWCKAAAQCAGCGSGPGVFLVVSDDRSLRLGRYGDEESLVVVASSGVEGADWCPAAEGGNEGSPAFAYSTGSQLVLAAVGDGSSRSPVVACELARLPLEHPEGSSVVFESVRWLLSDTVLLGGTQLNDEGGESGDEYSSLLVLRDWMPSAEAPPQGATLYTDLPAFVEEDSTPRLSGPYLHAVAVPRWGVLVRCHRKAVDDHVRLMRSADGEFGSGRNPQAVAVTEEPMMIRLPNGPDGGSNYVLGLAFDTTVPLEPLLHPLNAEKPPLVPPPVLLILTSDGALRVYGFGHLDLAAPLRPGVDAVMPLPAQPPEWVALRCAEPAGMRPLEDVLESEEEEERRFAAPAAEVESDSESGEEVTSPGILGSLAGQTVAKQATFPAVGVTFPTLSASNAATVKDGIAGSVGSLVAMSLTSSASSAAAGPGSDKAGTAIFGAGFGALTAGTSATFTTPAPAGGLFSFTCPRTGPGDGLLGAASSTGPTSSPFGSPAPAGLIGAAGSKGGSTAAGPFGAAAASAAALFNTPASGAASGAKPAPSVAFGSTAASGAAASPAGFCFEALSFGAVSTPQLGSSSAPFGGGGGVFAPPAQVLSPPVATDEFIPSSTFTGYKLGYIFTTRGGATGFYKDKPPPSSAPLPGAPAVPGSRKEASVAVPATHNEASVGAPVAKIAAVDILRPATKVPIAATPPPRASSPDLPAPKAQLADESKEAASAEASFLRELHEVRRMAAKLEVTMKDVAAGCPGACGASDKGGYKAVGASVEALARRVAALRMQYERANKRVANLFDGLGSLQSMLDALQLFSRGAGGADANQAPSTIAALEANLPLEPALETLLRDISTRLEALSTCLGELEDVLDSWEAPHGNQAMAARFSTSVLYKTLASAGSALSVAANRILVLAARLEEVGACPPGLVKDPSGPLAGLVAWCHGSGSTSISDGVAVVSNISSSGPVASPAASAARTPDGRLAGGSGGFDTQWHTPKSADGRRSPLLGASGTLSPCPQQQRASPSTRGAFDEFLSRLQALARIGGKVRVTRALRPPAAPEPPGAALLQLMSAAEAARGALPEAPEPTSPPRAQVKPTQLLSMEPAAVPSRATLIAPSAAFNFGTVPTMGFGNIPPTPSLTSKPAIPPGGVRAAVATTAQGAGPVLASQPKASQPPVPTMAQLQAASKLQVQQAGVGSGFTTATKTAATTNKLSAGGQPPVPSTALLAQAAQLQQKALAQQAAPPARPTDSGSSAGSTATSKPPPAAAKPQLAASPPVPSPESMRAAAAAHARMQQQQQQKQPQQQQKQQRQQQKEQQQQEQQQQQQQGERQCAQKQVPGFGGLGTAAQSESSGGFGFGFSISTTGSSSSSLAKVVGPSLSAQGPAVTAPGSKLSPDVGVVSGMAVGSSFGFGARGLGATASTSAASNSADGSSSPLDVTPSGMLGSATAGSTLTANSAAQSAELSASSRAPAVTAAVIPPRAPAATTAPAGVFGTALATAPPPASAIPGADTASLFSGLSFSSNSAAGTVMAGGGGSTGAAGKAPALGSFGMLTGTTGAAASSPAAGTSLFGAFTGSAAAGASGFGVFSSSLSSTVTSSGIQSSAPGAASSHFSGASATSSTAFPAGPFSTQGGIQSKAAMPTVQVGVFSSFGQAPAFVSPAAAPAPAFGSPAALGGSTTPAFGSASPTAPAPPGLGSSTFGTSSFSTHGAFGSPAPLPPAPAAPFGGAFGQSSSLGNASAGVGAFAGFPMQGSSTVGSASTPSGGFMAFSSSAPTPPAQAGGGFAAFASQGGGFGGFGSNAQLQPTQGGAFGSSGSSGFGAFNALGGGLGTTAGGSSASADLWKPRK